MFILKRLKCDLTLNLNALLHQLYCQTWFISLRAHMMWEWHTFVCQSATCWSEQTSIYILQSRPKLIYHNIFINVVLVVRNASLSVNDFNVIWKCNSEYDTEVQETFLIKKQNPILNKQLYASGFLFFLNTY